MPTHVCVHSLETAFFCDNWHSDTKNATSTTKLSQHFAEILQRRLAYRERRRCCSRCTHGRAHPLARPRLRAAASMASHFRDLAQSRTKSVSMTKMSEDTSRQSQVPCHTAHTIPCGTYHATRHIPCHAAHAMPHGTYHAMRHMPCHTAHAMPRGTYHATRHIPRGTCHATRHMPCHAAHAMPRGTCHATRYTPCHAAHTMPGGTRHARRYTPCQAAHASGAQAARAAHDCVCPHACVCTPLTQGRTRACGITF